jgi:hypothetical protein
MVYVEMSAYYLSLPDDKYDSLYKRVSEDKEGFIHIADKNGVIQKFYRQGEVLFAERQDGEQLLQQKVIPKSKEEEVKKKFRPFRDMIVERLRADFPEYTEENIQSHADILNEANSSIKKLIESGISPSNAIRIVMSILDSQEGFTSPEQIAEHIKKEGGEQHPALSNEVVEPPSIITG